MFRANSALALGAKHIRRSVSEASLTPSEFDRRNRIRSTKFFDDPKFRESPNASACEKGLEYDIVSPRTIVVRSILRAAQAVRAEKEASRR